jgi:hypothetical protein
VPVKPMSRPVAEELSILAHAARSIAQAKTIEEIKSLRDKAEAARQYAKSAALGLHIQNLAAELKLRAERKAGELLAQLSLRGGNRKSNSHHEILKLADLGIDRNKSARWQLAASIPDSVFRAYLAAAEESGTAITTQGLFRLASKSTSRHERSRKKALVEIRSAGNSHALRQESVGRMSRRVQGANNGHRSQSVDSEIIAEIEHHLQLLATILTPLCEDRQQKLPVVCKRTVMRLLHEMQELLTQLQTTRS